MKFFNVCGVSFFIVSIVQQLSEVSEGGEGTPLFPSASEVETEEEEGKKEEEEQVRKKEDKEEAGPSGATAAKEE